LDATADVDRIQHCKEQGEKIMNGSIPIDPEKGLDPHLMFCARCGGESNALTIGAMRKAEVEDGQYVYAMRGKQNITGKNLEDAGAITNRHNLRWEKLDDNERVPDPEPCAKCKEELETWATLVAEGGVYCQCSQCSMKGVIRPGTVLAEAVRSHTKIEAPSPIRMEFENCDQHAAAINPDEQGETDDG
jgi:hypothetical protein